MNADNRMPGAGFEALRGAWEEAVQEATARDPCLRTEAWQESAVKNILGVGASGSGLRPCLFVLDKEDVPAARTFGQANMDGAFEVQVTGEMAVRPFHADAGANPTRPPSPLMGGAALSRLDESRPVTATLGCILPDAHRKPVALTNMHFLAPSKGTACDTSNLSVWAGHQGPVIGRVGRWQQVTSKWRNWPNFMDAGVAYLNGDIGAGYQLGHIESLGAIDGIGEAMPGDIVKKRGATTGTTQGRVVTIMVSRRIRYTWPGQSEQEFILSGCTEVANKDLGGAGTFSRPGDSGSAVVRADEQGLSLLGLHFAANPASSLYCPIAPVLQTFGLSIPQEA